MNSKESEDNKNQEGNIFICERCGGTGEDVDYPLIEGEYFASCPHCQGAGTLDWLENIVGKKKILFNCYNLPNNGKPVGAEIQWKIMKEKYLPATNAEEMETSKHDFSETIVSFLHAKSVKEQVN